MEGFILAYFEAMLLIEEVGGNIALDKLPAILSVHSLALAQNTEIQPYEVIKAIDSVEIRFYPSATLVQTKEDGSLAHEQGLLPTRQIVRLSVSCFQR